MSYSSSSYEPYYGPVIAAQAEQGERIRFLRKTYAHLAGAVLAFVLLELMIFTFVVNTREAAEQVVMFFFGSRFMWLIVIGAFIAVGWLAETWARSATSRAVQYVGLGLYVVMEAVIFLPILCAAAYFTSDPSIIPQAGLLTLLIFGGLTAGVLITKKDFSFLGGILWILALAAFGVVIAGMIFGFGLGLWFSLAMVALACGFILYNTSNVLHHYRTDQHVAASLSLFASVALLFWYILQIFMRR